MGMKKLIGIALVVAGLLGLVYGRFSYTRKTHDAKIGPLEFSVKDKETVDVPTWTAVAAVAAGALLLVAGGRKG